MPTPFVPKASGEELYAAEVNAIYYAINMLEEAIGLTPGTPRARIDPSQLAEGIPGSKISSSTDLAIRGLSASDKASLLGGGTLDGSFSFGPQGVLRVHERLLIGDIGQGAFGILSTDTSGRPSFQISQDGTVLLRGRVYSDADSEITGKITALSGNFAGAVTVGGSSGIVIDGSSKEIRFGADGRIVAGGTIISHTGIRILQGSINLGEGRFQVRENGVLIARDAEISGTITATAGRIGGIQIESSGIHVGGLGPSTSGFSLSSDGKLYAKQGSFTGEIHAESGTLGDLSVTGTIQAGNTRITPSGIEIESGTINLGQGRFVVDDEGNLTATQANITGRITALSGTFQGPVQAGPNVVLDQEGVHVTGQAGIEVTDGSIVVRRTDGPLPLVEIGSYRRGLLERRGIRVTDGQAETLVVDDEGNVTVRGTIYATDGEFTGTIHATAGEFGGVSVTGDVIVSEGGRILAGDTVIDRRGITLTSGSINLKDRFIVTEDGRLTAEGARISGEIMATSGRFTGDIRVGGEESQVIIQGSLGRIVAGDTILSSTGLHMSQGSIRLGSNFSVTEDGLLVARSASIEGDITVRSGHISGELNVGNGVRIVPGRIDVRGERGVVLHGGSLIVNDVANDRLIVEIGTFSTPVVWPGRDIESEIALSVTGEEVGTGDGETTDFYLAESPVLFGSVKLYIDGEEAEGYIVDYETGSIFFDEPPVNGAVITADYRWIPRPSGIRVSNGERDTLLINRDGSVKIHGTVEATDGYFGSPSNPYRIKIDDSGIYAGELGSSDSPFGIYTSGPKAGSAYFKGLVAISGESSVGDGINTSELKIQPGGRIIVGSPYGARIELRGADEMGGGFYAFDTEGRPTVQISALDGSAVFTGAINATGGTISGNLTISTPGSDIRIVAQPTGVTNIPGIYMFQTDGPGIIRITSSGVQFSPNGGVDWRDAVQFEGITLDAITDGTLRLHDSGTGEGGGVRILISRTQRDEPVTLFGTSSVKLAYDPIDPGSMSLKSQDGEITYKEGKDYLVDWESGRIQRTDESTIPDGATVLATYTHYRVDINSYNGIAIHDGSLQLRSQSGVTLISGGTLNVNGLNVGVVQSDNLVANGDFTQASSAWAIRTADGGQVPGYPSFAPGEPYFGDWIKDRMGRTYRHGAAFWIPNKSNTTYDEEGKPTGWARVAFATQDFLGDSFGYAEIELSGSTYQWGQIEQDVHPFYNFSEGEFQLPHESFREVVASVSLRWPKPSSSRNTVKFEVDELVPHYVFVEAKRTEPFVPAWDNVHETYQGILRLPEDQWRFVDEHPELSSGDNVAYGCPVSSNAEIVQGTEEFATDGDFLRDAKATRTTGAGLHYLEIDLGLVQPINEIRVWHSLEKSRSYRSHRLEVSANGEEWDVVYDADLEGAWREGPQGKTFRFPTKEIRYIRDWIAGYELLDESGSPTGQVIYQNQWVEIQARHSGYLETEAPGASLEWKFTPHSRANIIIGYVAAPGHGKGYVEIDGIKVADVDQGDANSPGKAFIDLSNYAGERLVPRREHTLRIVFADVPENHGKKFTFTRIKLEDYRLEGPEYTSSIVIPAGDTSRSGFYSPYLVSLTPKNAKNYTGKGRQILRGIWDEPGDFSPSYSCLIRYRLRVRSERAAGGDMKESDHVLITHAMLEMGEKPTSFRRSSMDPIPLRLIPDWDPLLPGATGIQERHLANESVGKEKIKPGSIHGYHLADDVVLHESQILFENPPHSHPNKEILDQITGLGASGSSTDVARADHDHDGVYLPLTGGSISGSLTLEGNLYVGGTINSVDITNLQAAIESHAANQSNPHNVTAQQVGALVSINGIERPGGNIDIVGGGVINVLTDSASGRLVLLHPGNHDDRYYTKSQLAMGDAEVSWSALINVPAEFRPVAASETTRGGITVGDGLSITGDRLSVAFSGSGTALTAARSDHHHDGTYAKLSGSTITGGYVFTSEEDAIKLVPASDPNVRVDDEEVTLAGTAPSLLSQRPVDVGSETVTSLDGSVTYERGTDYEIDYWGGRLVRTADSRIPDGASVKVSYLATRVLFRITDPSQTKTKLAFDSEGNIVASSMTVVLCRHQVYEKSEMPGDFNILGNMRVSGSAVLGESASSVTSISGSLVVWSEPNVTKLFEVKSDGTVTVSGTLSVESLLVGGVPAALEGHDHHDLYFTKQELAASGKAAVHWDNLLGVPETAVRWPSFGEIPGRPSVYPPETHAARHALDGDDPITPDMIGAQPALGYTPVNKAGDSMSGDLSLPRIRLSATDEASAESTAHAFQIGPDAGANLIAGTNAIIARSGGRPANLHLNPYGGGVYVNGFVVWHSGNDGQGSGLDADLLDGKDADFYLDASNITGGILPPGHFSDESHGALGGGDLHAVATQDTAGFMSPEDKRKLDRIEDGAQVNQDAFASISVPGQIPVTASDPSDTLTLAAGANVQITASPLDKRIVISADHDHRDEYAPMSALVERLGYGILRGFRVVTQDPLALGVRVEPGLAHMPSGQRIELSIPLDLALDTADPVHGRIDVLYISDTFEASPSANIKVRKGTPSANPKEPEIPSGSIKLASVVVPAGASVVLPGNISDQREPLAPVSYNQAEAAFVGRQSDMMTEGWRFDGQGRLRLAGGIATGSSTEFVDVSARAPYWDDAAHKRHLHVYNEVPVKDASDATGRTYLLSFSPADDDTIGPSSQRINRAGKRIMVFRNGLLLRPYMPGDAKVYDYYVQNNRIIFAEAPNAEDHLLAFYETYN